MPISTEEFLSLFKGVRKTPSGWQALCPAHDDTNASLSIAISNDGKKLLKCHAGCLAEDVAAAVRLQMEDLFEKPLNPPPKKKIYTGTKRRETEYKYFDENKNYLYSKYRIDVPGKEKTFCFRRGDKNGRGNIEPVLYNLPKIPDAIVNEETVFVVEGEKQCDNLGVIHLLGVTNDDGAGKWHEKYSKCLEGANVVILPDNDDPGENHGNIVAKSVSQYAKSVKIVHLPDLPEKGDISDWLIAGHRKDDLLKIVEETAYYTRPEKPKKEYYYDKDRKEYLVMNQRCWLNLNEGQFKKNLILLGYEKKRKRGDKLSEVDAKIIDIREYNDVDYVGSLAGYKKGTYEISGKRILVTDEPKIIQPVEKEFKTLYSVIEGLFVENDDQTQMHYFLSWLKIAYESLAERTFRPGQMLVMAGPRDCGKSFLQKVITEILGGRSARPYKYMTDRTEFNGDLFQAEHLMIEDEISLVDIRSRRAFGSQVKQLTANDEHRCRPMYRTALTLRPFWRITQSLNDEPENLMSLPVIDDSLVDKLIILKAYGKDFPMSTRKSEERQRFWNIIKSELPGFLYFLRQYKIPEEIIGDRYGIKEFHNIDILCEIDSLAPEKKLLDLIDICLFSNDEFTLQNEYTMTAQELENKLLSNDATRHHAHKLLTYNTTCGTYLGRLAKKHDRIKYSREGGNRSWKIRKGE